MAMLAAALYLPAVGVPFDNTPEPQEGLIVVEMVRTGNWVLPRRNGVELPSKPPLYHWTAAMISGLAGGVSETTIRLPSVISGVATVGLVFVVAAGRWGLSSAWIAALVLGTSPAWVRWSVTARTDMIFSFALAGAFLAVPLWLETSRRRWLWLFAAAAGAATLAKGPAGAGLAVIPLLLQRRARDVIRATLLKEWVVPALLFFGIVGSWYLAAFAHGGFAFVHKQILLENIFRFLPSPGGPSRDHGTFYYLPALLAGMFPWSLIVPFALAQVVHEWRRDSANAAILSHLVVSSVVVLVVCTLASGKRANYILPLYPLIALLVGVYLGRIVDCGSKQAIRVLSAIGSLFFGLIALTVFLWALGYEPWGPILPWLHQRDREVLPLIVEGLGAPRPFEILLLTSAAVLLGLGAGGRFPRMVPGLIALGILLIVFVGTARIRPLEARLNTFEGFAGEVSARVSDYGSLRFLREPHYGLLFYLGRHVPVEKGTLDSIPRPGWALVWEKDWERFAGKELLYASVLAKSPRASLHRPDSRLFLVRFDGGLGEAGAQSDGDPLFDPIKQGRELSEDSDLLQMSPGI